MIERAVRSNRAELKLNAAAGATRDSFSLPF
jgi:hypothetical protein